MLVIQSEPLPDLETTFTCPRIDAILSLIEKLEN